MRASLVGYISPSLDVQGKPLQYHCFSLRGRYLTPCDKSRYLAKKSSAKSSNWTYSAPSRYAAAIPLTQASSCIFCQRRSQLIQNSAGQLVQGRKVAYHKSPASCKQGFVLAIDEHHPRHHSHIMLPFMSELMPPLPLNDLAFVYLVHRP
jgi:hypothetical protein